MDKGLNSKIYKQLMQCNKKQIQLKNGQNLLIDISPKHIYLVTRHMKRYLSLIIREMQIKNTMRYHLTLVRSVQFRHSVESDSATPWTAVCQASLSITDSWSLFKLMSIESVSHSTISSSVVPFSYHLQSFPTSGSLQMSLFIASRGQSIGVSASTSVLPMNIQD